MGWEVKIDMSGQSKDCLWVCNVKMEKFLPGLKRGTFLWIFGFRGHSVEGFENFFMGFWVPMSLTVADIFWPISTRSRWAYGYIVGPSTTACIWANIAWGFLVPSQTKSK